MAALFAVRLLAKPMVITLPFVLFLLDYWPLERMALDESHVGPAASNRCATGGVFEAGVGESATALSLRRSPDPRFSSEYFDIKILVRKCTIYLANHKPILLCTNEPLFLDTNGCPSYS